MLAGDGQLDELIARASKHGDILLFKCIRNIAQFNPNSHETFVRYLENFCIYVQELKEISDNSDLMLEVLGTMVYIPTDDWDKVVKKMGFLDFLHNSIVHEEVEDDILLECVMLVATICRTEKMAKMISKSYLIKILQDLLGVKQEDDEMVQQILNTFFKFLFFESTRKLVLHHTQMV